MPRHTCQQAVSLTYTYIYVPPRYSGGLVSPACDSSSDSHSHGLFIWFFSFAKGSQHLFFEQAACEGKLVAIRRAERGRSTSECCQGNNRMPQRPSETLGSRGSRAGEREAAWKRGREEVKPGSRGWLGICERRGKHLRGELLIVSRACCRCGHGCGAAPGDTPFD